MIKSKLAMLTSAIALGLGGAAYAQDTGEFELGLSGEVPEVCYIKGTPTGGGYATFTAGGSGPTNTLAGNTLTFPVAFVNATTAAAAWPDYAGSNFDTAPGTTVNFEAVCNFANSAVQFTTANAGMRLATPPTSVTGDFADSISYAARLRWNGDGVGSFKTGPSNPGPGTNNLVTAAGGSTPLFAVADPTNATMSLRLRPRKAHKFGSGDPVQLGERDDFPLLAGTYQDTLTIRFGANP